MPPTKFGTDPQTNVPASPAVREKYQTVISHVFIIIIIKEFFKVA